MSSRYVNIIKNIVVEGNTHRIWQIINKSPLIKFNAWWKSKFNHSVAKYRTKILGEIEPTQEELVLAAELSERGFIEISDYLRGPETEKALEHFNQLLQKAKISGVKQAVNTKSFWIRLTDEEQGAGLSTENPFVQLALNEKALRIISLYLRQAPYLHSVLLTHSIPSGNELKKSQLWHLDNDNHRMVKMFTYFSDVENDDDGPFTLIPADLSEKINNGFFKKHLNDDQVFKFVDSKEILKVKGRKLTMFICDTHRCYHMGSRVSAGHDRHMLTCLYISIPSPYPNGENRILKIDGPLSKLQKAAVVQMEN